MSNNDDELNEFIDEVTDGPYSLRFSSLPSEFFSISCPPQEIERRCCLLYNLLASSLLYYTSFFFFVSFQVHYGVTIEEEMQLDLKDALDGKVLKRISH